MREHWRGIGVTLFVNWAMKSGVLIEVPVMLTVESIVNRSKAWYEGRAGAGSA